ncbi:hypothetical protein ACPA0F_08975 [Solibacillus silvestris]
MDEKDKALQELRRLNEQIANRCAMIGYGEMCASCHVEGCCNYHKFESFTCKDGVCDIDYGDDEIVYISGDPVKVY